MKNIRLTKEEREIEDAPLSASRPVSQAEFKKFARAFARQRKDAILHIRINSQVLADIKKKAKGLGIPYQTLVSEFLRKLAA